MAKKKKIPKGMVEVTTKSFNEIANMLDSEWECPKTNVKFIPEMSKFCGKAMLILEEPEGDHIYSQRDGFDWSADWFDFPKGYKPKSSRYRTDLVDDYTVDTGGLCIEIGCQTIDKDQERRWLELLCERAGYELQG